MIRQLAIMLLSCFVALMTGAARAENLKVSLILSDSSPPYRQFAESFSKSLAAAQAIVAVAEAHATVNPNHADLIVAVGIKAMESAIVGNGTPVLVVMVPDTGYQELMAKALLQKNNRMVSAIYLNQPWDRQLAFLRAALPDRRKIGLLYSPNTRIDVAGLSKQIGTQGGSLVALPVQSAEKLFASLESVLEASDLLLAIPDNEIYNSGSIRNVLLTSYRKSIPLIGLSQSYVNAGALCAVFSTAEQIAEQAGATVAFFAQNRQLPGPQYPENFTVAVNQQVARSMGIELPLPEKIRSQMGKTGRRER